MPEQRWTSFCGTSLNDALRIDRSKLTVIDDNAFPLANPVVGRRLPQPMAPALLTQQVCRCSTWNVRADTKGPPCRGSLAIRNGSETSQASGRVEYYKCSTWNTAASAEDTMAPTANNIRSTCGRGLRNVLRIDPQ